MRATKLRRKAERLQIAALLLIPGAYALVAYRAPFGMFAVSLVLMLLGAFFVFAAREITKQAETVDEEEAARPSVCVER